MRRRFKGAGEDLFSAVSSTPSAGNVEVATKESVKLIGSPLVKETEAWLAARATTLGNLFASERAAEYVAILRAFAQFRAGHEPEPLHEDLARVVCGEDASNEDEALFKSDLRQLKDWQLVTERIEKERLRGYRDTRRTKFRYRLCDDAVAFVAWIENRCTQDLNPEDGSATRHLLDRQCELLHELCRRMRKVVPAKVDYETAVDVLYRIEQMRLCVEATARALQTLNLRLLSFGADTFSAEEAKDVVGELGVFLERFGRRFGPLRTEIVADLVDLRRESLLPRWRACVERMREETAKLRHIVSGRIPDVDATLADAAVFYGEEGRLVELMGRVVESARKVWGRLNAKLRELERRNHRLEDVQARLADFTRLGEDEVPFEWMRRLLEGAAMRGDAQIRPGGEKSRPPLPKRTAKVKTARAVTWITPRQVGEKTNILSIAEARAERMRDWMERRGIMPDEKTPRCLSSGTFEKFEDFANIMRLVQTLCLGNGEKASRHLGVACEPRAERVCIATGESSLTLDDLALVRTQSPARMES